MKWKIVFRMVDYPHILHIMPKTQGLVYSLSYKKKKKTRKEIFLSLTKISLTWLKSPELSTEYYIEKQGECRKTSYSTCRDRKQSESESSCQIKIVLTCSLLNNPLVSTPFRNISIQLGKGDVLMDGEMWRWALEDG